MADAGARSDSGAEITVRRHSGRLYVGQRVHSPTEDIVTGFAVDVGSTAGTDAWPGACVVALVYTLLLRDEFMLKYLPQITPRAASRAFLNTLSHFQFEPFAQRLKLAAVVQCDWLMNRVRIGEATAFGQDHGFASIKTVADFRRQVPVAGYDHFSPYIEAVAAGNVNALVPATEKLLQFTITTGSSGVPKLNPVTNTWLKEYRRAWDVWGLKLFVDHPSKIGSKMLQMTGTWNMGTTKGGYQISMVSALLSKIQNPLLKPYYLIPEIVSEIPDPVARHYVALRLSIAANVGWILLMNPGTLIRLAEIGDTHADMLLRDLTDGTLTQQFEIPGHVRTALASRLKRDATSARRLADMAKSRGRLLPKDYWDSPVISCWLAGTAGFQSRYLSEYFGPAPTRDMGLVSSEGRHTIPIADVLPAGVPSIDGGFYEYVPVEEWGKETPETVDGHELQDGSEYRLVMTTSAGYYRFDIGDIVKCRGHIGQAPLLEFVQKSARVGDLEGEKLTEHQVVEAAHTAAEKLGINLSLITAVPRRLLNEQPRYDFLVEASDIPQEENAEAFLALLDSELESLNFLWKARRREGVLQSPQMLCLQHGEWERTIQAEVNRRGTGDYQYKHPGLVVDESWLEQFRVHRVVHHAAIPSTR